MTKENAINFLLYSMLGVTVCDTDDSDEDMVKAAIIRAYSDATMQGAYNSLFRKDLKNRQELLACSARARQESGFIILTEVDRFFNCNSKLDDYAKWHNDLCVDIIGKYKNVRDDKKPFFTYGNAQKWVNMTIKYLCILDALSDSFIYRKRLNEFKSQYFIPADSYIIEAISLEKSVRPWSRWSDSEYNDFREASKELCGNSPLDWENETWIKQSKIRRKGKRVQFRKNTRTYLSLNNNFIQNTGPGPRLRSRPLYFSRLLPTIS